MTNWLSFLFRSIFLGLVVALILLLLMPELRQGNLFSNNLFSKQPTNPARASYKDALHKASPAVVNIYTQSVDTRPLRFRRSPVQRTSLGSGVIMSDDGYLLTCHHVITNAERILVALQDGRLIQARLVGSDLLTDLAVLKIEADNLPVIPQDMSESPAVGDMVFSIGNPYNLGQTTTSGIISAIGRNELYSGYASFLQTDAVMNEGASGGALVDSNGNLVGINNSNYKVQVSQSQLKDVAGVFFAMPVQQATHVMRSIIENGRVIRGYLGITPRRLLQRTSDTVFTAEPGISIREMDPQGSAAKAGLQINDVIYAIDGKTIHQVDDALGIVADTKPGNILLFSIIRDEQLLDVEVKIEELRSR